MKNPNALVLNAPGINCNEETAFALEQAGADVEQVHIRQLNSGDRNLSDYQILALPGGFSHGDDIAAGRILGTELRTRHAQDLDTFTKTGKAIVGICNGFQVLVETGLLPNGEVRERTAGGDLKTASLVHNQNGRFEARWVQMAVCDLSSPFINTEELGPTIELPVAHGEGRAVYYQGDFPPELVALRYVDDEGSITESYPANPNGSKNGVAAISNTGGNILGMMPHPERFIIPQQHYNWHRGQGYRPYGSIIFKNIVNYAKEL